MTEMYDVGCTTGVYDLFHIGHLNLLLKARQRCRKLVVGVATDEIVAASKGRAPIVPLAERMAIVQHMDCVDVAFAHVMDWQAILDEYRFDAFFKGDDWVGKPSFQPVVERYSRQGVAIEYFPYTPTTSTTRLRGVIGELLAR